MSPDFRSKAPAILFPRFRKLPLNCPAQPEHKWRKLGFHENLSFLQHQGCCVGDDENHLMEIMCETLPESWRMLAVMDLSRFCVGADGLKRWRRRRKGLGIIFARLATLLPHHLSACLHASVWRLTDWLWINWSICIFGHELFDLHAHADPIDLLVALIDQLTNDQIWCRIFPSALPQGLSVGPVLVIWINVELIVINPDKCRR